MDKLKSGRTQSSGETMNSPKSSKTSSTTVVESEKRKNKMLKTIGITVLVTICICILIFFELVTFKLVKVITYDTLLIYFFIMLILNYFLLRFAARVAIFPGSNWLAKRIVHISCTQNFIEEFYILIKDLKDSYEKLYLTTNLDDVLMDYYYDKFINDIELFEVNCDDQLLIFKNIKKFGYLNKNQIQLQDLLLTTSKLIKEIDLEKLKECKLAKRQPKIENPEFYFSKLIELMQIINKSNMKSKEINMFRKLYYFLFNNTFWTHDYFKGRLCSQYKTEIFKVEIS